MTTCASTISQKAALAAWTAEAEAARGATRQTSASAAIICSGFSRTSLGWRAVAPEGAFYTMVDVSAHGDSMAVAERLLEHGVISVPGSAFGPEGEGFLRVSFCADLPVIAEGVRRMKRALEA